MIVKVYAVKDHLEEKFMGPSYATDEKVAIRQFKSTLNQIQLWKDNPQDYTLYELATFDDETGIYVSEVKEIINGRSLE